MRVTIKFDDGVSVRIREFDSVIEVVEDDKTRGQYIVGLAYPPS